MRPRNAPHLYGSEYPFIQTGDITASLGRITSHTQNYSQAGLAQSRLWPAGTMCITIAANIAETGILQYPACFPDSVVGFIADPNKADVRFVEYMFRQLKRAIQHEATGSVQDNINLATLSRLRFPLPDLWEQRAIAEALGAFDDKIAANAELVKIAGALGAAIFADTTQRSDARVLTLSDIATNVPGKYLAKADYQAGGSFFVYGSNSVMGRHGAALVDGGFAVLAKIGSYCGNLRWSERAAWVNNNASAIVPNGSVAPAIVRQALDRIDMLPHRAGTGQPYIRMNSLFATPLKVPSTEQCEIIGPTLQCLSELEVHCSEENTTLCALRDTMLPELVSGRLRVKDAEKQIEEVL